MPYGLGFFCLVSHLYIALPAMGQTNSGGNTGIRRESGAVTAEEILSALRQSRPTNEVIPSDSLLVRPRNAAQTPLLPEGFRVLNVVGHISLVGDWWVLHSQDDARIPSIRLLFNRVLEQMVRATQGTGSQLLFSVSGEVTVFRNENYLLPRVAARYNAPENPAPRPDPEPAQSLPIDGTADDVLSRLRAQIPEHEILSSEATEKAPSHAEEKGAAKADSVPLTQRPGRVWGQKDAWVFSFESATDHAADLPLRVLPGQHLERMIAAMERSTMPVIFLVSGEVTTFDGSSYLLIRAATQRQAAAELSK